MRNGKGQAASISVKYGHDDCTVRLHDTIKNDSIFLLCDEVDLAIDYYQYTSISIEIDSHGGALPSLDYYISKLDEWREKSIIVSTLALTRASSAAAYILALGDIGKRRAYPSAELLFHFGHYEISDETLTRDDLDYLRDRLEETNNRYLERTALAVCRALENRKIFTYPDFAIYGNKEKQTEARIRLLKEFDVNQVTVPPSERDREVPDAQSKLGEIKDILNSIHQFDRKMTAKDAVALLLIDADIPSRLWNRRGASSGVR